MKVSVIIHFAEEETEAQAKSLAPGPSQICTKPCDLSVLEAAMLYNWGGVGCGCLRKSPCREPSQSPPALRQLAGV